jgi:gamma-tubulin complex component 3
MPAPPAEWAGPGKGKSKAEVLTAWRTSRCAFSPLNPNICWRLAQPPFPQHLLLRDALYLLQGIDGRYVRFAIRPAKEQNPYLTDKGKRGDGMGFPLGKEEPVIDGEDEEEVVGLDFMADEQTVSSHWGISLIVGWTYLHSDTDGYHPNIRDGGHVS